MRTINDKEAEDLRNMNLPMNVSDVTSMLRIKTGGNIPPYTNTCLEMNNNLIDEWEKTVLREVCDGKGQVPSGHVWRWWLTFLEGKQIHEYVKLRDSGVLPRPTPKQVEFWQKFLQESSIDELHRTGSANVAAGWNVIESEIRAWTSDQKWESVYSISTNPLDWHKEALKGKNTLLMTGQSLPFWNWEIIKEVKEKVATVVNVRVEPQK